MDPEDRKTPEIMITCTTTRRSIASRSVCFDTASIDTDAGIPFMVWKGLRFNLTSPSADGFQSRGRFTHHGPTGGECPYGAIAL